MVLLYKLCKFDDKNKLGGFKCINGKWSKNENECQVSHCKKPYNINTYTKNCELTEQTKNIKEFNDFEDEKFIKEIENEINDLKNINQKNQRILIDYEESYKKAKIQIKSEIQLIKELINEANKTKLEDLEKYIKEKKKEIENMEKGVLSFNDYFNQKNRLNNKLKTFKDLNKVYDKENLLNVLKDYEKLNLTIDEEFKSEKDYETYKIIIVILISNLSVFIIILYIILVKKILKNKKNRNSFSNTGIMLPNE